MEGQLLLLRRKVSRLEDTVRDLNEKIVLILEKFLNSRANVLRVEEDLCTSLVAQLNSVSNYNGNRKTKRNFGGAGQRMRFVPSQPRPLTRPSRRTVTSAEVIPPAISARATESGSHPANGNQNPNLLLPGEINASANTCMDSDSGFNQGLDIKLEPIDEDQDGNLPTSHGPEDPQGEGSDIESDEDQDSDPGAQSTSPKPQRARSWKEKLLKLTRTFPSIAEAKSHILLERKWTIATTKRTPDGQPVTMYYMCRVDNACPIRMLHKVNGETGTVTEYVRGPIEHIHDDSRTQSKYSRLPPKVMQALEDAYHGGETNWSNIYTKLMASFGTEFVIPRRKVKYYVEKLKEKQYGDLSFMRQPVDDGSEDLGGGGGSVGEELVTATERSSAKEKEVVQSLVK